MNRTTTTRISHRAASDTQELRALGYRPPASARLGLFGSTAIGVSATATIAACVTLYGWGAATAGPAVMIWTWLLAGPLVCAMAASVAELTSVYPTSGALGYVTRQLGGPRWAWYTETLRLVGLVSGIAVIDYGTAQLLAVLLGRLWGVDAAPAVILVGLLAVQALAGVLPLRATDVASTFNVWWTLAGVTTVVAAVALALPHHRPIAQILDTTGHTTGWAHPLPAVTAAVIVTQFALSGFAAPAHLAEDTDDAAHTVPRGILRSLGISWTVGLALLAAAPFATTPPSGTSAPAAAALTGSRPIAAVILIVVAQLLCGHTATVTAGRALFDFSRVALLGPRLWASVDGRTGTPRAAVILTVAGAGLAAIPELCTSTGYTAVASLSVLTITFAYAVPVLLRLRVGRRFLVGRWNLGRWSAPVGVAATVWAAAVCVMSLSAGSWYALAAVAATLATAWIWWRVAGRRTYKPRLSHTPSDLPGNTCQDMTREGTR